MYHGNTSLHHGKGVVDGIGGSAKARVREQIKSKKANPDIVQSASDFTAMAIKLMPNVKVVLISEEEVKGVIAHDNPWNDVKKIKPGILKVHYAKASAGSVKMYHTVLDTNDLLIKVYNDNENFSDPNIDIADAHVDFQSVTNIDINLGDWVVVVYDGKQYPEVTEKRGCK